MAEKLNEIESQALQLSPEERGELIHRLIISLEGEPEDSMPPKPVRISLSNEAQADADAADYWYTGKSAFIAADEFADELDRALGILNRFPELGHAGASNTRTLALHSFP